MFNKIQITTAGTMGFLAVALGAFGAHILEASISAQMMGTYETGVLYHLVHSAVLLGIALLGRREFTAPFWFIFAGILLFSFSLYVMAVTGVRMLGIITPFGGVSFLIGWGLIVWRGVKMKTEDRS